MPQLANWGYDINQLGLQKTGLEVEIGKVQGEARGLGSNGSMSRECSASDVGPQGCSH